MNIAFPQYSGIRCLMMPFIQGDVASLPEFLNPYSAVLSSLYIDKGDVGYLTIDESHVQAGRPQRGARAKYGRALHTEVGRSLSWGTPPAWGGSSRVTVDPDVAILIGSSLDDTCAVWPAAHSDTSEDGDIGYAAALYPYETARLLKAGELARLGVFTPHESLPVARDCERQFLRIVGSGVHGREEYFTRNERMAVRGSRCCSL